MTEREQAYLLAERLLAEPGLPLTVLDRPNADPDDDLRLLARQLLRHRERAEQAVLVLRAAIGEPRLTNTINLSRAKQALALLKS